MLFVCLFKSFFAKRITCDTFNKIKQCWRILGISLITANDLAQKPHLQSRLIKAAISNYFKNSRDRQVTKDWEKAKIMSIFKKILGRRKGWRIMDQSNFIWENRSTEIICKDLEDNRWLISQDGFAENKSSQANLISSYDSPVDQGKTIHVIHLDGSEAFGTVSHNSLARQIRKPSPDETNRVGQRDSLKWKGAGRSTTSIYPPSYTI